MASGQKPDTETLVERTGGTSQTLVGRLSLMVRMGEQSTWFSLIAGRTYVIGRDASADIPVPARAVSRSHAKLVVTTIGVEVEDLGSRNGTKLNGRPLIAPTLFRPGDDLRIGGVSFTLHGEAPGSVAGLLDHDEFMARVSEEVDRCRRYGRPLALMLLDADANDEAISPHLAEAYDRLREVLRPMDVVGHFARNKLEVLLPEADAAESDRAARRIEARLLPFQRAIHVGVAQHPQDGHDGDELLAHALERMRDASRQGVYRAHGLPDEPVVQRTDIVVRSAALQSVFEMARRAATSDITVLIQGETGVGKELVVEAIHDASPRREGPLVRVNCAALAESLIESELFGHERGAFTGADRTKAGLFEQASGGTIFLDEIGEVPLAMQPKLLRVLQTRTARRIGGAREMAIDVRVVAATNRDLRLRVQEGRFRDDLYFRLAGVQLIVPPLRDRKEDIPPLAELFLRRAAKGMNKPMPVIPDEVMVRLIGYRWPGNVRELINFAERAMLLSDDPVLSLDAFPASIAAAGQEASAEGAPAGLKSNLDAVEREMLLDALRACEGNQTRAAQLLSMPRRTFLYKLKRHGISRQEYLPRR